MLGLVTWYDMCECIGCNEFDESLFQQSKFTGLGAREDMPTMHVVLMDSGNGL